MKLALLFLLCFAGVSYQQRASPRFYPRSYYQPLLNVYSNQYANKEFNPFHSYDDSEYYGNEGLESIDSDAQQVQGRTPSSKKGVASVYSPLERSFFLPAAYLSSLFNVIPVTTITSTVSTTVSAAATIASVVTCIPKDQFSVNTIAGTTLTTACTAKRRRRSIDQNVDLEEIGISPSQMEKLETSELVRIVRDVSGSNRPEILSSQQTTQEVEDRIDDNGERKKRFLTKFSSVVTTTSTITSYSFATTTITKSLSLLAVADIGKLTCLPSNYSVCS